MGVAKNAYSGIDSDYAVYRGDSNKPLYITAAGLSVDSAKNSIQSMAGMHCHPLLLKRVDRLCRDEAASQKEYD
ncbi:MAG: hypothetical protein PQJ58_22115 [Spirochaetales bacterium]|nr:hypothetical protein [Spirochaetales bacterium]